MSMSRKDYQALADAFSNAGTRTWSEALANVADVLKADNPRFDRERFINAATLTPKDE